MADNVDESRIPATVGQSSATFGPQMPTNALQVNVTADNLNIHPSSINALGRIAETNPQLASQLVASADKSLAIDGRKYTTAAICTTIIALAIILGSVAVLIEAGVVAGLMFFLACVVVSAIVAAIFTGKVQDLSWTVGLVRGQSVQTTDDDNKHE